MFNKIGEIFSGRDYGTEPPPSYMSISHAIDSVVSRGVSKVREGYYPVHVSSAIRFCPRKQFLMQQSGKEYSKKIRVADEYLWAMGKALEQVNRSKLIEAYGSHNIVGKWSCACGKTEISGLGRDPYGVLCRYCRTSVLTNYGEFTLNYSGVLQGNPDLLILLGPKKKLHVVEFKSINPTDFKDLASPNPDYMMQAYSYLKLMELNRELFEGMGVEIDTESFTIHYSSKGYQFTGSVQKEFEIKVKDLPDAFIEQFDRVLAEIIKSKGQLELPDRVVCSSIKDSLAVKCPVREECFGCG